MHYNNYINRISSSYTNTAQCIVAFMAIDRPCLCGEQKVEVVMQKQSLHTVIKEEEIIKNTRICVPLCDLMGST